MVKEGEITRKESRSLCYWHEQILAVIDDGFVSWTCPRGKAAHSGPLPPRTLSKTAIENVSVPLEGNRI